MPKEIRLSALDMNSVGHGMWSHPRDQSPRHTGIEYWQHLARTAERGLFDAIFLAGGLDPGRGADPDQRSARELNEGETS
jgi:alkanesulfonate monooxygenase SsuD/methylene tetrahydromethanopterin reductase-like flavin-dependent oxidoreductase (luciferase family)